MDNSNYLSLIIMCFICLCSRGEDVPSILLCVNKEVSEKAARLRIKGIAKQMPVYKVTLRKKLVFRVADQP